MAYFLDTATVSDIARRDTNRLVGSVAKALAANSPWINVLQGGVFRSGMGDTITQSVEMQAAPGDSLAVPTFTNDSAIGGTTGTDERTGKVDFTYRLQSKRGTGPVVDVKKGFTAFKSSYLTAEDALKKLVTQYVNADIQAQMVLKSATKVTAKSGNTLNENLVGGNETDIDITFAGLDLPDAQLSFKALHAYARHIKEALFAEMFQSDGKGQPHFRFIGSSDIVEAFRNELSNGAGSPLVALTQGSYRLGEQSISGYSFETSPAYRGLAFGVTHRPLRFNAISGVTNLPTWIDPVSVVEDVVTNEAYSVANTSWLGATYEIGVLIADGAFERQLPEQYVGEGTFKFAPQLHMGELQWHYVMDSHENMWGDFGWHKYQITRAYKPKRPQFIVPIMFKRAQTDLGLEAIVDAAS